jgi:eukaryotic-like serine/threonine-protein kinase
MPDEGPVSHRGDLLPVGTQVGAYQVTELLGTGSFGNVYAAVHQVIGKQAAIKVLHSEHVKSRSTVERFLAEAQAVNRIQHHGIVDIFDFGQLADGRHYFAMELLRGQTLDAYVTLRRGLSIEETLTLLRRIARALDAAHDAGVAHRDLKPDNIFLVPDEDGGHQPKLLDFGVAKLDRGGGQNSQTRTGQMLGTPLYMSPEQWRGKKVDHRADIYSLGVVAYEMLSGHFPFIGDAPGDVMVKACTEDPTPIRSHRPDLPEAIDQTLALLLAKDPARRPPSATAAVRLLREAAVEGLDGGPLLDTYDATSDAGLPPALRSSTGHSFDSINAEPSASAVARTLPLVVDDASPDGHATPSRKPKAWIWGLSAVAGAVLALVWFQTRQPSSAAPNPDPPTDAATAGVDEAEPTPASRPSVTATSVTSVAAPSASATTPADATATAIATAKPRTPGPKPQPKTPTPKPPPPPPPPPPGGLALPVEVR